MNDSLNAGRTTGKTNGSGDVSAEFKNFFWDAYGRKEQRKPAEKAFAEARKKASLEEILAGVKRYRDALEENPWRQQKLAAGWLKNESWKDSYGDDDSPVTVEDPEAIEERRREAEESRKRIAAAQAAAEERKRAEEAEQEQYKALCFKVLGQGYGPLERQLRAAFEAQGLVELFHARRVIEQAEHETDPRAYVRNMIKQIEDPQAEYD